MLSIFDGIRDVGFWAVLARMAFAVVCGALIGLERSYKNRSAGFRTHILVCTGATVASMTGLYLYLNLNLPTDISRLGAQIIAGLGFIGAGTIIVTKKNSIKGLTTAAGLWTTGIIGLAVGGGFYEGALLATALVLLVQLYFSKIGQSINHPPEFRIWLDYTQKAALDDVLRFCKDRKLAIKNLQITTAGGLDDKVYTAVLSLNPNKKVEYEVLLNHIRKIEGIVFVEIPTDA